jgi:DNA modification methylase
VAASIKRFGFIQPIVLDPFLGSGTTLISAEKSNRVCYGLELDPKFVDVIVQRWVDYTGVTEIKCNGKEIVWPVSEAAYDETDQENDQGE